MLECFVKVAMFDTLLKVRRISLAIENGVEAGAESRGSLETGMTREQIADALARARLSSGYQDCN